MCTLYLNTPFAFPSAVKGPNGPAPKNGKLYTEEDWNTSSTLENGQAYWVSKVCANPTP